MACKPAEIAHRAEELLWVIARCDVENVSSHRDRALEQLRELESLACGLNMPDLYQEVFKARA
jgi:hypothetical protein